MDSKIELERVKNLPVEKQSLEEPKDFSWVLVVTVAIFIFLAVVYAFSAPDKILNPDYSWENLDVPYEIYPKDSIYSKVGPLLGAVIIFISGVILGGITMSILDSKWKEFNQIVRSAKNTMIKQEEERRAIRRQQELDLKKKRYSDKLNELKEKYGEPDRFFTIKDPTEISSQIIPFSSAKRVSLLGKDLAFDDILSVQMEDDKIVRKGQMTAITTTNNGNMIKRAVVGDVLLGGAGAVIGGSTAEKNTTYQQEPDVIIHNYCVLINIKDLKNPILRILMGQDGKKSQDLVALINAIIASK